MSAGTHGSTVSVMVPISGPCSWRVTLVSTPKVRGSGMYLAHNTHQDASSACGLLHKSLYLSGPLRSLSPFCLQNSHLLEWTRGDSNPWPPPCEGGALPTELRAREASAIVAAGPRIARRWSGDAARDDRGEKSSAARGKGRDAQPSRWALESPGRSGLVRDGSLAFRWAKIPEWERDLCLENAATPSAVVTMPPQPITFIDVFSTQYRALTARFSGDDLP
jgi:hypothetical protein